MADCLVLNLQNSTEADLFGLRHTHLLFQHLVPKYVLVELTFRVSLRVRVMIYAYVN